MGYRKSESVHDALTRFDLLICPADLILFQWLGFNLDFFNIDVVIEGSIDRRSEREHVFVHDFLGAELNKEMETQPYDEGIIDRAKDGIWDHEV